MAASYWVQPITTPTGEAIAYGVYSIGGCHAAYDVLDGNWQGPLELATQHTLRLEAAEAPRDRLTMAEVLALAYRRSYSIAQRGPRYWVATCKRSGALVHVPVIGTIDDLGDWLVTEVPLATTKEG